MPFAESNGVRLNYRFDGAAGAPVLVHSNSLGANLSMWDPQIPALAERFRVLRYDTRGHGQSSVTTGPYSVTQLGRDVVGLLDAVGIERAYFCGLSMGGLIGMWLGIYTPERINRLVLCNTAAKIGATETWNARIEMVRTKGMGPVAETQAQRWFTPAFIARAPDVIAAARQMIASTSSEGYAANCGDHSQSGRPYSLFNAARNRQVSRSTSFRNVKPSGARKGNVERETGLEPATFCLGSSL